MEQPMTNYPAQIGLGAPAEPGRFGDLTINSDWGWMYDAPFDLLSALTQNQWYPIGDAYYALFSGEAVNQGTWTPQNVEAQGQALFGFTHALRVSGGPGIALDQADYRASVDLAVDSGLEFDAAGNDGKLRVLPNAAKAILREAAGVGVGLAANPGLEFDGNNGVAVKPDAGRGIQVSAGGVGLVSPAAPTTTDYVLVWDHTIPGPVWVELKDFTCP